MFSLIACVGKKRELGKGGKLIFHIREDMQFFRDKTMGHKIVMGRKTWESLPHKLPGRTNLVISRREVEGADETIRDLSDFIAKNKNTPEEIFVIGGGMVYFEFLKHAKNIYLTEVDAEEEAADTFFPEFNREDYKKRLIKEGKDHDLAFTILEYTKK